VVFIDFMERLERYMTTALDQANNTWKALLAVHSLIILISKGVLPTYFKYEGLVSLVDTLHERVRVLLDSGTVTQWADAVERARGLLSILEIGGENTFEDQNS